eukprot:4086174-Pyramimonas_sp.AAC.1
MIEPVAKKLAGGASVVGGPVELAGDVASGPDEVTDALVDLATFGGSAGPPPTHSPLSVLSVEAAEVAVAAWASGFEAGIDALRIRHA